MELWAMRLDRPLTAEEEAALLPMLPPERRERRAKSESARQGPLCAYALLRLAFREELGWTALPPMARQAQGKPWFPDCPEVCFSLSHTAGAVLAGVSKTPVGVDIERFRTVTPRLMARFGASGPEEMIRLWVRWEAWGKRTGEGIFAALERTAERIGGEGVWQLETFPGYAAAACGSPEDQPSPVRFRTLEDLVTFS